MERTTVGTLGFMDSQCVLDFSKLGQRWTENLEFENVKKPQFRLVACFIRGDEKLPSDDPGF